MFDREEARRVVEEGDKSELQRQLLWALNEISYLDKLKEHHTKMMIACARINTWLTIGYKRSLVGIANLHEEECMLQLREDGQLVQAGEERSLQSALLDLADKVKL